MSSKLRQTSKHVIDVTGRPAYDFITVNGYTPDFTKEKFARKILSAIQHFRSHLGNTDKYFSMNAINKCAGYYSSKLAVFIRNNCLCEIDPSYHFGSKNKKENYPKRWALNAPLCKGLEETIYALHPKFDSRYRSHLNEDNNIDLGELQLLIDDARQYLDDPESIRYVFKSNRYWQILQNIKNAETGMRDMVFAAYNMCHVYDINTAAPTLLYEQYLQLTDVPLKFIEDLIHNKTVIRKELAEEICLSVSVIKKVLTALFTRAPLSVNERHMLFNMIGCCKIKMDKLKANKFIQGLREDIKTMWIVLDPERDILIDPVTGEQTIRDRVTCKARWKFYYIQESNVMKHVKKYLKDNKLKYFTIHDGWYCDKAIDLDDLMYYILLETGINLTFSHEDNSRKYRYLIQDKYLPEEERQKSTLESFFEGYVEPVIKPVSQSETDDHIEEQLYSEEQEYDDNDFFDIEDWHKKQFNIFTSCVSDIDILVNICSEPSEEDLIYTDEYYAARMLEELDAEEETIIVNHCSEDKPLLNVCSCFILQQSIVSNKSRISSFVFSILLLYNQPYHISTPAQENSSFTPADKNWMYSTGPPIKLLRIPW